jgi:hypothetical protein
MFRHNIQYHFCLYLCLAIIFSITLLYLGTVYIFSILITINLSCIENGRHNDPYMLELDFEPFNVSVPRPNRSSSIGNGVQFLNRHLSSIMFRNRDCLEPLLDFLRGHRHKGHVSSVADGIFGTKFDVHC